MLFLTKISSFYCRGFGFVKMKDPQAAEAIMSDEHTIDGRLVDVKRALPRDKAPGPAK